MSSSTVFCRAELVLVAVNAGKLEGIGTNSVGVLVGIVVGASDGPEGAVVGATVTMDSHAHKPSSFAA